MRMNLEDEVIVDWALDQLVENRAVYLHTEDGFPIGVVIDYDTFRKMERLIPEEHTDALEALFAQHTHIGDAT